MYLFVRMYYVIMFASFFIISIYCEPTNSIKACNKGDVPCMTASANAVIGKFTEGFPELGVPPSDPLSINEIVGDLSTLKFKLTDSTVTGLKNCQLSDVNMNTEKSSLSYVALCKNFVLKGHYNLTGQLMVLPVQGDGDYELISKLYKFKIYAELKEVKGNDGKQHYAIKNFKFTADPQENIVYDFKNLLNGQKELADTVLKFINENWKEVATYVQEPVINALMKKTVSNINKYLKLIPIDEIFLN